ncbi:ABC transporter substrate-binding protein [Streptomyces sp. 8ZJF_21]|uniref:nSTAND3 domain-containing NTPase n=1 Tax=Streptomyces sp. 8ZJF_21 TaxID=2903141 RepID=UPI001E4D3B93|nr:ABC transporter substrate-binding protein [Streptomyces sp. 8ZJF_21]MCD9587911.1 ABC transporter substrate-binding protein [Streptomyces sp. 8ZJF_21]
MREGSTTHVSAAHGPTATGPGPQYNNNNYYFEAASRLRVQGKDPRTLAQDTLDRLSQCFVPPPGIGRARDLLSRHSTVLISGPPGSGRRSAAMMLLHELSDDSGSPRELDMQDEQPFLDARAVGKGDRILLDLSGANERHEAVWPELSGLRSVVRQRAAWLTVVLPQPSVRREAELLPITAEIKRPKTDEMLMRHLRVDDIRPSLDQLGVPDLARYLENARAGDVARLSDLIRRARDEGDPGDGFPQWRKRALGALNDRNGEVGKFVAGLNDGRPRALLLSLAMFHGSTPETVHRAATELLKAINHPGLEEPRLNHPDLTEQFKAIKARTGTDGRVRFEEWAYDPAVRAHFWTYYPDLRTGFRTWVRACARWLAPDIRATLVGHFAEQSLRTDHPEDLWSLADEWTVQESSERFVPDAAQALAAGLRDDRHGRATRQKIYDWAKLNPSRGLRNALVPVCAEVMSVRHPDQALVRLHHLARREGGDGRRPALDALLTLARGDGRLFRLLLDRVDPAQWAADTDIFLALAETASRTRSLYVSAAIRNGLALGWAEVLRTRPPNEWKRPVVRWLDASNATVTHHEALLGLLLDGCEQRVEAFNRMYVLSRDWAAAAPGERGELAGRFAWMIDVAQGVQPQEAAP